MNEDEYWVAQIVYTVAELAALSIEVRAPIQKQIDSGDLILSGGEISAPLVCYSGKRGPESRLAQAEALAKAGEYAKRGHRVKVIANLDMEV